jgi:hypothetical protein
VSPVQRFQLWQRAFQLGKKRARIFDILHGTFVRFIIPHHFNTTGQERSYLGHSHALELRPAQGTEL